MCVQCSDFSGVLFRKKVCGVPEFLVRAVCFRMRFLKEAHVTYRAYDICSEIWISACNA